MQPVDLLIIGAGAAGLAAARIAGAAGQRVAMLEARDRIGGRIYTIHDPSCTVPVELGAEFVHGMPPEIWNLAQAARLPICESHGEQWQMRDGRLERAGEFNVLDQMQSGKEDITFEEFLQRVKASEEQKAWAIEYVEGYNAARKERIGIHGLIQSERAAERIQGDRIFRITRGYDSLIQAMRERLPDTVSLYLGAAVQTVRWSRGSIAAETVRGSFRARRAIMTLPLGVLQARDAVHFEPELEAKREAAGRLAMGEVIRVTMRFRERFWQSGVPTARGHDLSKLSFLFSHDSDFPTWWSAYPMHVPVLIGWAAGARAERLSNLPEHAIVCEAVAALARITGEPEQRLGDLLEAAHLHNWQTDPCARGAYSYIPVNTMDAPERLAVPVEDTLFFAGEATDTEGLEGTVHGAIATGERAAREVIERERDR
jgi:monoamine oxidase